VRDASSRPSSAPADCALPELFEAQVARTPERVAVIAGTETLTYRELDRRVRRMAGRLRALGVAPEARVGVLVAPSADLVVAILGVLKAGGAYVPADVESPRDRIAFILTDAAVRVVIVDRERRSLLPPDVGAVVVMGECEAPDRGDEGDHAGAGARPDNLAYVVYTSGSTGRPKGVLVEHHSVVSLCRAASALFEVGSEDVWTLGHSVAFDFSVWEIWGALSSGGCLVVVPRAVARSPQDMLALLERERVTVLSQTPSAFMELLRAERACGDARRLALRYVVFGGEALDFSRLRPWFDAHGDHPTRLVNMYGITETTVHVTSRRVTAADAAGANGSLIGRAIPGWDVHLLDDALRRVPAGEIGEICVGGAGVARGYLNRPDLQAERFVRDPFATDGKALLYRSGDLARRRPDGDIEYLGRSDQQVKLRGFRIELGEIESLLGQHDAVAQAAVVLRDDPAGDKRLVAYWVSRAGVAARPADLRSHLEAALPAYMVPSAFVPLEQMPLTANGKLDRAALPAPGGERPELVSAFVPARTPLEAQLAALWSEVLGVEPIGVHDSFFELGGHSLSAARMMARLRDSLGATVFVRDVFDHPTIAALAPRIVAARGIAPQESARPACRPLPEVVGAVPMSSAQAALWFLQQLTGRTRAYLLAEAWRLTGPLDVAALGGAMSTIVARHAPLRTRFELVDGIPTQTIGEPAPCEIAVHDVTALEPAERSAAARRIAAAAADRAFDVAKDTLLRAELVRLGEREHVLIVVAHHIASDAWSEQIFRRELSAHYAASRRGLPDPLPALPIRYADFAVDERRALTAERLATLQEFWAADLAGLPSLELPTDRPRPLEPTDRGAECAVHVPRDLVETLRRLGHAENATLHMVLLAAYEVLLSTYSGQVDFAVATPVAGRDRADVEGLIGLFVNTLVVRADVSGDPTFRALVRRVRERSVDAYAHRDLPFDRLVAHLRPARDPRRMPLVQVVFQLLQLDAARFQLDGLDVERFPLPAQRARFDVEMTATPVGGGLQVSIVFNTDLFDVATMERFGRHYLAILRACAGDPDSALSALSWLDEAERHEQLVVWSGLGAVSPPEASVTGLLAEQVARRPEAVAVSFGHHRLTYGQLGDEAGRLARRLRALGVTPRSRVAICLDRSVELIVAMAGVLEAGAAYVPLDPHYPPDRLQFMMRDAEAEIVVTAGQCPSAVVVVARRVVRVDDAAGHRATAEEGRPAPLSAPTDVAYVMYTSGSTGRPTGVAVPHRAIARLVRDTNYVELRESDRVAFAASPSFDATTFEVWGALLNGAEVVVLDRDTVLSPTALARAIVEHGITVLFLTTGLFHEIAAQAPAVFGPLRYLVVGGEAMDARAARAVLDAAPPRHLVNGYGPTENTTFSTTFDLADAGGPYDAVPIGRPIRNSTCYVLEDARRLLPAGAVGELCVGGAGLAAGYVNQPDLTAERFVAHPFRLGERLYRTGDLVRWRSDGQLLFVGRRDRQLKLRGYRVEPAEIEQVLGAHPAVRQCAVITRSDGPGARLVAYWVGGNDHQVTGEALQVHLRALLPEYMVPAALVRVSRLPTTANGKVDLAALQDGAMLEEPSPADGAPRSAREAALAAIWAEVLNRPAVGVHENFFEIGGSSLVAVRLAARMEGACGRPVSAATIFAHPTIAQVAEMCEATADAPRVRGVVEIRRGGRKPPLYFPPGLLSEPAAIIRIIAHLPDDQPIYMIEMRPAEGAVAPSMETLAAGYVADLLAAQPDGPFSLAGYSFSALLAFEMARQLKARGRDVRRVIVIDSGPRRPRPRTAWDWLATLGLFLENLPRWAWSELRRLQQRENRERLWRSTQALARQVTGVRRRRGATVGEIFDVSSWSPELVARANANLRALATYGYGPYDGRIVLFRARTRPLFHSHARDLGWRTFARGGLEVVDLPGDHHTITWEPQVRALGQRLRDVLEQAVHDR
jgi:amino acid adenylation domain-containing protein